MKTVSAWLLVLLSLMLEASKQQTCTSPFQQVTTNGVTYCVKCDSSCATCFDESVGGCVTCIQDFDYDEQTSMCVSPNNKTVITLETGYKYYQFATPTWVQRTIDCGYTTLFAAESTGQIQHQIYIQPGYKIRIILSLWWIDITRDISLIIMSDVSSSQFSDTILYSQANSATNNSVYCSDSAAFNYDNSFTISDSANYINLILDGLTPYNDFNNLPIKYWGVREFTVIQYLCHYETCATCNGPDSDDCVTCTDSRRKSDIVGSQGQCLCDSITQNYYKHPDVDSCVFPCPSKPSIGQYYGNSATQSCVIQCPTTSSNSFGVLFADDTTGTCVSTCAASITIGSDIYTLYHDITNRRCVTVCPTTQPYKDNTNRKCVSTCPTNTYKLDSTMSCIADCSLAPTTTVQLFIDTYLGYCVDDCEGNDWWADSVTGYCTDTCTTGYFKDNTTTRNKCVQTCSAPLYFGDGVLGRCIDYCYAGNFGDYAGNRQCVSICTTGYGTLTGSRACVAICPNQTWGEDVYKTCLLTMVGCGASSKYADNYTHMCVDRGACKLGQFSTDVGYKCVISCPSGTYTDPRTLHCETACTDPYFADPGANKCVTECQTADLYADVDSSRTCVATCNITGSTPYRQFYSKTCVNVCPNNPYTFADDVTWDCVYNCSQGQYQDYQSSSSKKCVTHCPSPYWGDNSTGYGVCVAACPVNPPLFGDTVGGYRMCVQVCSDTLFGDQRPVDTVNSYLRACISVCPDGYFSQADSSRRCVLVCNDSTYGDTLQTSSGAHTNKCKYAEDCSGTQVGDPSTRLCTTSCPTSQGTFADDIVSFECVIQCPINNSIIYFADPTDRWCRDTCTAPNLYGNNLTRTCQTKCIDFQAFADAQHTNRYCIQDCTDTSTHLYYRNNFTKVCVVSTDCPSSYFADNVTKYCVAECPLKSGVQTWGYYATQTCVTKCYNSLWGDDSTGVPICKSLCPSLPAKWSYDVSMLCVSVCPAADLLWGQDYTRTCVSTCPMHPNITNKFTYAYNTTRRCLQKCPSSYYGDYIYRMCWSDPSLCSTLSSQLRWGDPYNNSCTYLCTASPWNTFGDNVTHLCTTRCSLLSYADNYTGTRVCVSVCPGSYDIDGTSIGTYDTYGDNHTQSCVLHCVMASTWADWQTHLCLSRCSGDASTQIATYSQNINRRCVIALWCPLLPDILYGDNITRACVKQCFYNASYYQWADNITRTCIPKCYTYTNGSVVTTFYGDISTGSSICVYICPSTPRLFGQNTTHTCMTECPDDTYGDQTGNRSCVLMCPNINGVYWYAQLNGQICVTICEDGTWGNKWNATTPKCVTVATDCIYGEYADSSTHLCVSLCPQSMDYFGDPSTRKCVKTCPTLLVDVVNATANINQVAGQSFADYSTRLCVKKCPQSYGPYGTFGDNSTSTCVQRCPTGSYGDPQTSNRYCVSVCVLNSYADDLSMTCVSECPASPPYFADASTWKCVSKCPSGTWASSATRQCVSTCPTSSYRLSDDTDQCVTVCPSSPDLYADDESLNCVSDCSLGSTLPYADPTTRTCVSSCLPLYQYNNRCIKYCPSGYYANSLGNCVAPTQCDTGTYADNSSTSCIGTCLIGYADSVSRYCIAICPSGTYGSLSVCVSACPSGQSASDVTQLCISTCTNNTYSQNNTCKPTCQYLYANNITHKCDTTCPSLQYTDATTHRCVQVCPDSQTDDTLDYYIDTVNGECTLDCGSVGGRFKDFVTKQCVGKCSSGYWGNLHNYTCITVCVSGEYGYQSSTQRTCYLPASVPDTTLFADLISIKFVSVCPTAPTLYFGDRISRTCVSQCATHSGTVYYGDPASRQCESACTNTTYTADPLTYLCTLRCSIDTYRDNSTGVCVSICANGHADNSTGVCVSVCPVWADTYGHYNLTSSQRICVRTCPSGYYAQSSTRTCLLTCSSSSQFALNSTRQCVSSCMQSYANPQNYICVASCSSSILYPYSDNSTNKCVSQCPSSPDYYADANNDNKCVYFCVSGYFADSSTRSCVSKCPNVSSTITYGDVTTGRCVSVCPWPYYSDNTTNKCVTECPSSSYADNDTRLCVQQCSTTYLTYGDPFTHRCSTTCSGSYFGSKITQQCIPQCESGYYGDPLSTLCVSVCPNTVYLYGQNVTRKCVGSCAGYSGYADNYTRTCVAQCQNQTNVYVTFADTLTMSCVMRCPPLYFMQNSTNQCVMECLTGYADNYSQFCVQTCPSDPQTYGSITITNSQVCVYVCDSGYYSDNSTHLCVDNCPSSPNYFGDSITKRCVLFCSQGTYSQITASTLLRVCTQTCTNTLEYADNLTRSCVVMCPSSQQTYADDTTNKCVRVCPSGYFADNSTQSCVSVCPDVLTINTYADALSHFCVLQCPYGYFGKNDTNVCVQECSSLQNLFGHPSGRVCVGILDCYPVLNVDYYADDTTRQCVQKCPLTRWADLTLKKCVQTCPSGYYRNSIDQTCVDVCPSIPELYADPTTLNCVYKCPNSYYSVVQPDGDRVCASECASYSLYMDNTTNKCVSVDGCSDYPYMYADPLIYKCVYVCSGGYFADNKTNTCVQVCPSDWQLFGSFIDYTCVQLCEDGTYADAQHLTSPRTCQSACSNGYYASEWTSSCVQHCVSVKVQYYQDSVSGKCVDVCPLQSYADTVLQVCLYSALTVDGYVSICPSLYYADPTSKQCVSTCPYNYYANQVNRYCMLVCTGLYYADTVTGKCVQSCSSNYFALDVDVTNQKCVQYCPSPYYAQNTTKKCVLGCSVLLGLNQTNSCENQCPQPYFADSTVNLCVLDCNPFYADVQTRTCLPACTSPSYSNPLTFTCDLICPSGYYGRPSTRACAQTCLTGTFADPSTNLCVTECPLSPMLFADSRDNTCMAQCTAPLFAYQVNRTCLSSCPNISTLVYLADGYTQKCVLQCISQLLSFADYSNNICAFLCPLNTYANNLTKQCVSVCPDEPVDTFSDNTTRICMDVCPVNTYGYSGTLNCVGECWWPFFADPTTHKCVQYCPQGYFSQNATAMCTATCAAGSYADPTTNRCVVQCPASANLYKFNNWTCVSACPSGYLANQNISECVQVCNSMSGMYAYLQQNVCVMECPYPYRGFAPNHTCILSCPTLYFYNNTRNTCTRCPTECLTCTSPTSCQSCISGYNLFNSECSRSCSPSSNIITYAHPTSNLCVQVCPSGYYGDNSTYTCVMVCPNKQYGSVSTGLCQDCPQTCALCVNTSYCTSCESSSAMAIDNMCYSHCNTTHPYSYNSICYTVCPSHTYLSYTNVYCIQCSDLCATCTDNASYCLTCADRYLYQHQCVNVCPSGYYGSVTFECLVCNAQTDDICKNPLKFTTEVSVQNFQYVVSVKFNQAVSINKLVQNILKVNLKVSRRMLSADIADLINNGVTYTYKILSDGTIKLYLNLETDLSSPVFTVRFTDPTAVVSLQNGGTIQDVDSDFSIEKVQYYPVQQGANIGIRKAALFTVAFILVLYALTWLFTDTIIKPIQMLQLMFFHSVVSAPMPACFYFFTLELRPSLLSILPNWAASSIPKDVILYSDARLRTVDVFVDYNFLRNLGQILFYIVVIFGIFLVFLFLSNKRLIQHKQWHKILQIVSVNRFRFMLLNDVMSLFYIPILWFGFLQFQNLFGSGIYGLNGFVTLVLVILALFYPFILLYQWWKKPIEQVSQNMSFLANGHCLQYRPLAILQTPVTYFYLLVCVIWLVALDSKSTPQMIMLIFTNLAYIVYLCYFRPFSIHINTIYAVVWSAILITIQAFLLYFNINNLNLTSVQKTNIMYPLLIVISVFMIVMVIWSFWRSVYAVMDIWSKFKNTQFYKLYGDQNVEQKSEVSEVYEKYEKVAKNQEPVPGDIIVQKVYNECNDKGENVIKVRKKVLKKKKKVGKLATSASPSLKKQQILKEQEQIQEEGQFIRINKVNPFDYDYDDDYKIKKIKEPMKRTFDDDLREIASDYQEKKVQEVVKKQTKLPKLKQNKKLILNQDEKPLKDIEQISLWQSQTSEQELRNSNNRSRSGSEILSQNSDQFLANKKSEKDVSDFQESAQRKQNKSEQSKQKNSEKDEQDEIQLYQEQERKSNPYEKQQKVDQYKAFESESASIKQQQSQNISLQKVDETIKQQRKSESPAKQTPRIERQLRQLNKNTSINKIWDDFELQSENNEQKNQKKQQSKASSRVQSHKKLESEDEIQLVRIKHEPIKNEQPSVQMSQSASQGPLIKQQSQEQNKKQPKSETKGIDELIEEEQSNKKKKLLFLFEDDLQQD